MLVATHRSDKLLLTMAESNNREKELESALRRANTTLQQRTRLAKKLDKDIKSIKDNRLFFVYLVMRKSIEAPKKLVRYTKHIGYLTARRLMRTDTTRRVAIKIAKKARRIMPGSRAGKNTRLFVEALDATRRKQYQQWVKNHYPNKAVIAAQTEKSNNWSKRPLISILVPTYNTDISFLRDAIDSVQNQSYQNWELCIADDASTDQEVRAVIQDYAKKDERIKYVFRKKNGHISEASNSALELATGEFTGLLDHDDVLWPNALYEVVKAIHTDDEIDVLYSDEEKISENGKIHEDPYFKPDWSPDQLRCHNYMTHFTVMRTKLARKVEGFHKGYEGAQDWDLILRTTREARKVFHIPTILYSWRKARNSTALRADAKGYAWTVQEHLLADDLNARGFEGKVMKTSMLGFWKINYRLDMSLVSIIIPTKDQYDLIKKCLESIAKYTTYPNYEIIIVDTGSTDKRVWSLYESYANKNLRVETWEKPFNFSSVCNYGAKKSNGKYLLFLNNDTEVKSVDWVEGLMGLAQQKHVGAVGCKLLYPDERIQHAGIILGDGGFPDTPAIAGHIFGGWDNGLQDQYKIMFTEAVRNSSAVTAACIMISRQKFDEVNGFDESFKIAFNDVDFCLKLRAKNYANVYNANVRMYHHESVSVGRAERGSRDLELFKQEHRRMAKKWGSETFENDPYFNKNYTIVNGHVEINPDAGIND